ncbi:MAG: FeoB-associated Cys-rich membrane protein [Bacteroidales bacterium]
MIQEIITYIILAGTLGYIAYKIFFNKLEKSKSCGGCESSCSGCELTKLKGRLKSHEKTNFRY